MIFFPSVLAPFFCMPFFALGMYLVGYQSFAKSVFICQSVALILSGIMSFIPFHERPSKDNLTFWDTRFRGPSSFPSGHVIPYTVLTYYSFKHFGVLIALLFFIFLACTIYERLIRKRHYLIDILGGVLLSFIMIYLEVNFFR